MKKQSLLFLSLILISLIVSTNLINWAYAQTTYNWIQNSGFDDSNGNIATNNGFETGTFTGWTVSSGTQIRSDFPHSGVYMANIYDGSTYIRQIFDNISVSIISELSIWYLKDGTYARTHVFRITYNDSAITDSSSLSDVSWTKVDMTSVLVVGKFVWKVEIVCTSGNVANYFYVDDLTFNVTVTGQTTITPITAPWFTNPPVGTHYPVIESDTSQSSPNSCYFEISSQHYDAVMQVISNLASDSATNFTLYALDASGSGGATLDVKLHYTDGSWSSSTPTAINGSWIQYNFTYLIVPHKIIDEVYIKPTDYSGSDVYIDTVSLLSTNPVTSISFSFDLSPSALWINNYPSGYRLMEFGSFENQAYTITCTMYNNSVPCGNGTFLVTSSLNSLSGIILNGIFSFNIAKRSVPVNNTIELFNIDITSNLFNTSVTIKAYWYKLEIVNPNDPNRAIEKTNQFVDAFPIMLIMALFIIPATYYLGVGGFIGGFSVASIVCVWTGLAPTWFIAVTVLTDIVMIFFATRQKTPTSEM